MQQLFNVMRFNLGTWDYTAKNTVVTFNGESISALIVGANVLDVKIGAPMIEVLSHDKGVTHGRDFVRRRYTTRKIVVSIELPLDKSSYAENVRKVRSWASSDEPRQLILDVYKSRYIECICTNLNDITPKEWWMPVEVEFTAFDPFFYSNEEKSVSIGSSGHASFTIEGDAPGSLSVVLAVTSGMDTENLVFEADDGKYVKPQSISGLGELVVDYRRKECKFNDSPIAVTLPSRYSSFGVGEHIISAMAGSVIKWRERWL